MPVLPTGTVTFLFTDIEGSTRLWEERPDEMRLALARHDAIMRQAIEANHGVVFKTIGDAFCAAFPTAPDGLRAAIDSQHALGEAFWSETIHIKVRMALHTGEAELRDDDYFGQPLNRVARILATGHGGQVLISDITHTLCLDRLPDGAEMVSLGEHHLKDLGRPAEIFQLGYPGLPREFPPLRSLSNLDYPNNLPKQITSFVGRDRELAEVKRLSATSRLVTLTGSGGCGKTRLALQAASDLRDRYPDGLWFVELAPLSDPSLVPQTVAGIFNLKEEPGKAILQTLTEHLKGLSLMLILDNCEHLLSACARLIDTLLRQCPRIQVLASSREGLGISGELTYRVPSLALPDTRKRQTPETLIQYESVRLFVERARYHNPEFALTTANAPSLASVCTRLDGIPLAIELAAARVRAMSAEQIDQRLDQRFRLLTGGSRAALPRQQTLRSLIDWSYDLLNDSEKALLCRLSVFAGGWSLAEAEEICAGEPVEEWEVLDLLTSLADKSLVIYTEQDGHGRYRLLETVRQYGRDRLAESGEVDAVRDRHRDSFQIMAERMEPRLQGGEQADALHRLEEEHDNLRAAIEWSVRAPDGAEAGLVLCGALWRFWLMRGYLREGREHCAATLGREDAQERTVARAKALNGAGNLAWNQGDYDAARALLEQALELNRELGNRAAEAANLNNLGMVAQNQGDYGAARTLLEQARALSRELGNRVWEAACLNNLGMAARGQGDFPAARALLEEALEIHRELDNHAWEAACLNNLGCLALGQEDLPASRSYHAQALSICAELGNRQELSVALEGLADVAAVVAPLRAARLWGAAEVLRESIGSPLPAGDQEVHDQRVGAARARLGDDPAFDTTWSQGRNLSEEQAVALALEDVAP